MGGRGNDKIYGGAGGDYIHGEWGSDILYGQDGNDLMYGGYGADVMNGGKGNDRMSGGDGNDRMWGQGGNDKLYGGLGKDLLAGGSGKDTFVFDTKLGSKNIDTIADFSAKDDTIFLDRTIFTKAGKVGDLASSAFYIGARKNRHSPHPDHCCDEIDDALEVNSPAVVSCCEPAEVLHSVEASLDAIALFVGALVVFDDDFARAV